MKATRYFATYFDAYNYYPNGVPSTEIAIVGDSSYILVSTDNANNGNTTFYDAGMTNDQIVDTMVDTAYVNGTTYGYSYGYPLGYTAGEAYGYTTGHAAGYSEGYSYGYSYGYTEGEASVPAGEVPYEEQYFTIKCTYTWDESSCYDEDTSSYRPYFRCKGLRAWEAEPNTLFYRINGGEWIDAIVHIDEDDGYEEYQIHYDYEEGVSDWWGDVEEGDVLEIKCTGEGFSFGGKISTAGASFEIYGNIMSLLNGDNFAESILDAENEGQFQYLFDSEESSFNLVSAENLILPINTTLNCYYYMFKGCTSLTTPPTKLPATTLAESCYASMFEGCTSLTTAPQLPAITLAQYCYQNMFQGCTSLNPDKIEIAATTLAAGCFMYMFNGCTSLNCPVVCLGAEPNGNNVMEGMFYDCTALTIAPFMPQVIENDTYTGASIPPFVNCTELKYLPYGNYIDAAGFGISDQASDEPLIAIIFGDNGEGPFDYREIKCYYAVTYNEWTDQNIIIASRNIWKLIADTTAGKDPDWITNDPNNV